MNSIMCTCNVCGIQYVYEEGGEAGYSRDICGPYCDGLSIGDGIRDELLSALGDALEYIDNIDTEPMYDNDKRNTAIDLIARVSGVNQAITPRA
jgi:hypothetical protein